MFKRRQEDNADNNEVSLEAGNRKLRLRGSDTIAVVFGIALTVLNTTMASFLYKHDVGELHQKESVAKAAAEQAKAIIDAQDRATRAIEKLGTKEDTQICLLVQPQDKRALKLEECKVIANYNK